MILREPPTVQQPQAEERTGCSPEVMSTLLSLEGRKGRLTAAAVLEEARDPKSPLHSFFEWDDSVAAAKWRLEQARTLIRRVRVQVTYERTIVCTPRYVHDPSTLEGLGYIAQDRLREEPVSQAAVLRYEMIRATSALERVLSIMQAQNAARETVRAVASMVNKLRAMTPPDEDDEDGGE